MSITMFAWGRDRKSFLEGSAAGLHRQNALADGRSGRLGGTMVPTRDERSSMAEESGFQIEGTASHHYEIEVARFMKPLVQQLVDAVVAPGQAVLDVACGTGFASRAAAVVVGDSGRVVGTDINPGMLAVAQSVPDPSLLTITWTEASALDLPFSDSEFDTIICSQGVQFFPDPVAGLTEMGRVGRPGGSVAAAVWGPLADAPYLHAQIDMLVQFCGADTVGVGAAFSTREQVEAWFAMAGLQTVDVAQVEAIVHLPPVREYMPAWLRALPWSAPFFELDAATRDQALGFVENRMVGYGPEPGTEVPFRTLVATGTVPGSAA